MASNCNFRNARSPFDQRVFLFVNKNKINEHFASIWISADMISTSLNMIGAFEANINNCNCNLHFQLWQISTKKIVTPIFMRKKQNENWVQMDNNQLKF